MSLRSALLGGLLALAIAGAAAAATREFTLPPPWYAFIMLFDCDGLFAPELDALDQAEFEALLEGAAP